MDHFTTHLLHISAALFLLISFNSPLSVSSIGINYGQIANNLPSPDKVVPLMKCIGADKVKLYDADPKVLKAFANTDIEFVVGIGNEYLSKLQDPDAAQSWVKTNVQRYLPATKITSIAVGNEVLTFNDTSLSDCLLPAMQSIHTALVNLKLDSQVTVTTAHSLAVLQTSYPPSAGAFRDDLKDSITPILDFLSKTCSPFLINAYPFFAYKGNSKEVSLDFVLFQPNAGIVDSGNNLHYDNMLFAQIDAVYAALDQLGYKDLPVQISETGWPSKGDDDEPGASPENAKKYNGNLFKVVNQTKGTPAKPDNDLNIFVFALFNENLKPGPTSERNYGLFKPDGSPAYNLGFSGISAGGNSGRNTSGALPPPYTLLPDNPNNGYMSISSAGRFEWENSMRIRIIVMLMLIVVV
ncbi:putative glucan endo-1,3-beta-D-glucosidase [Helianthus annuus]|uniref:glucan endo-1,3-beta-D-glucosidase n=1 Tax=Helianthus annuus TaxID=4232 RepID=A0A251VH84_HELAN|nr:glucan endo-1,3-beta-glucosidase 11 [Helianthus annuus]KAF5818768.1 putative glucan endo-1,3-beta-D-glucosidase [Helianthus annuus]KAJ0605005.1 putative glucan endo-1,3-beta-D-glucosidase [Helianthus annuus]KAJ0619019.1 putative glucan endo-1,3-beta-D-glucosidase [Helianthus annuus]KAJ0777473.1 putative glucan endo-1,3-beta-D-glucosidase [Helianthus annuus]KAJ0952074.1 putative glucan endo-1,3-beta-D-glucosidase [Helianthus annuus]